MKQIGIALLTALLAFLLFSTNAGAASCPAGATCLNEGVYSGGMDVPSGSWLRAYPGRMVEIDGNVTVEGRLTDVRVVGNVNVSGLVRRVNVWGNVTGSGTLSRSIVHGSSITQDGLAMAVAHRATRLCMGTVSRNAVDFKSHWSPERKSMCFVLGWFSTTHRTKSSME